MDEQGSTYRFVSDPTMAHGDVKLVVGGVEIEDKIGVIAKNSHPVPKNNLKKKNNLMGARWYRLTTVPTVMNRPSLENNLMGARWYRLTTVPNRDEPTESGEQSDEEPVVSS